MNADPMPEGDDRGPTPPFSLWAELGLPEPEPLGEGKTPPVDWEILRRLVRQELPEQAARMTFRLIDSSSEWNAAHAKLLVDEFKSRKKDAPS